MTWQEILNDLLPGLPILLLCAAAILVIAVDWFLPARRSYLTGLVALACLGATLALLAGLLLNLAPAWAAHPLESPAPIFGQRLILDRLGLLLTLLFVTTALATVFVSLQAKPMRGQRSGEYYALLMLATVAMSVTAASRDFLVLYLAIETISLPSYVLVGYFRTDRRATEASLKYILYGAVASAVMLFGMSYLYGVTGTTTLPDLYRVAPEKAAALGVGLIFLLVGLGFKMALVPFHSWCPDVYEGAPTAITAYLSVASK
ncbi:MAG: proton-conducting transporter membrane subunit, partial [Candidatus Sumerlaeia bacterium]|nr:proton-conducting transporter membrane subunit [Candidatus Sumerlaeia bacterium]